MPTPYEFGFHVGQIEKQSVNLQGLGSRLFNAGSSLAGGARSVNEGAKHLVKGFGQGVQGVGQMVGTKQRASFTPDAGTSMGSAKGLGGVALSAGREAMKGGERMIRGAEGTSGISRDLLALLGHGTRLGGRAARGVGHVTNAAGEALQFGGKQLENLGNARYGVPTVAAAGLLGGTAAVAPKLPLPGVKFRSPVDVSFKYKTQKPVEFEW